MYRDSLCSVELCKELKKNKVKVPCEYYFYEGNSEPRLDRFSYVTFVSAFPSSDDFIFPCPFLDELLDWFIKNYSVTVAVSMGIYAWNGEDECRLHWDYNIVVMSNDRLEYPNDPHYGFNSYHEALESGLKDLVRIYLTEKNG